MTSNLEIIYQFDSIKCPFLTAKKISSCYGHYIPFFIIVSQTDKQVVFEGFNFEHKMCLKTLIKNKSLLDLLDIKIYW